MLSIKNYWKIYFFLNIYFAQWFLIDSMRYNHCSCIAKLAKMPSLRYTLFKDITYFSRTFWCIGLFLHFQYKLTELQLLHVTAKKYVALLVTSVLISILTTVEPRCNCHSIAKWKTIFRNLFSAEHFTEYQKIILCCYTHIIFWTTRTDY